MSRKAGLAEGVLVVGVCEGFVVLDVVHHHFFWKDSFECTCPEGYTNAIADAAQCLDINKYTTLNITCWDLSEQCNTNSSSESACLICANSQGSFACTCNLAARFAVSSDSLTQAVSCKDVLCLLLNP
eukprot:1281664-Rhodomonas_salina.2